MTQLIAPTDNVTKNIYKQFLIEIENNEFSHK